MFADLELYLMGLGPAADVKPIRVFDHPVPISSTPDGVVFSASGSHMVTIEDLIKKAGPRKPAWPNAPRAFRAITVILTDTELSPLELQPYQDAVHWYADPHALTAAQNEPNFSAMTRGRATIRMDGLLGAFQPSGQ